jgi:hypothetical protein
MTATIVGSVLDFIDWLSGATPQRETLPGPPGRREVAPRAVVDVPLEVRRLLAWVGSGQRPHQPGIPWPRERWRHHFPQLASHLNSMPDLLDRELVGTVARRAHGGNREALEAFVTVMAWGFGTVGYGPYRTRRIIDSTPEAASRLHRVATALQREGVIKAYELFSTSCRLMYLGPSFGTKFLYFAQPASGARTALIHDALVTAWFSRQLGLDISSPSWDVAMYRRYLDMVARWADALGCEPDDIEYAIFQTMADERGNQWANDGYCQ